MNRATIGQLKEACDKLSKVTGKVYAYNSVGNGFWHLGEQTERGLVVLGDMKKLREWVDFLNAYREGYAASNVWGIVRAAQAVCQARNGSNPEATKIAHEKAVDELAVALKSADPTQCLTNKDKMWYVVLDDEGAWLTQTPSEKDTIIFESTDLAACERELTRACE